MVRDKLRTKKQKGSMVDYFAEFDVFVISLPESNIEDLIYAFIYIQKENLHSYSKPDSPKEVLSLAEAMTVIV